MKPDAPVSLKQLLIERSSAEILHPSSGVRVFIAHEGNAATSQGESSYRIEVPTAHLDPRKGQRHRAKKAIDEARWRDYDSGLGSDFDDPTKYPLDESADTWGYSIRSAEASHAADAAVRLLCSISDIPLDTQLTVRPVSNS